MSTSYWCLLSFLLFFNRIEIAKAACISKCITVTLDSNLEAKNNGNYVCGSGATLHCTWEYDVIYKKVRWVRYNGNEDEQLNEVKNENSVETVVMSIPTDGKTLKEGLYSCQYSHFSSSNDLATNVSISIEGSGSTCKAGANTTAPSTSPPPSTIGPHFPGMNPLIYTIVSGVLLFILILVSIITCWIRSRKNARLRALLPQDSPQDYLDYIQQGQFTPLTSIEFIASLRERPPTYNESQVIQRRMDEEEPTTSTVPPPLPPRNPSMRQSPIEGNDTPTPTRSPPSSPAIPDTPTPIAPPPSPPNLFPTDVTLSFFLDEPSQLEQLPPPLLVTPDILLEQEGTDSSTETSNFLVGVIPSINNAMV